MRLFKLLKEISEEGGIAKYNHYEFGILYCHPDFYWCGQNGELLMCQGGNVVWKNELLMEDGWWLDKNNLKGFNGISFSKKRNKKNIEIRKYKLV